MERPVSIQLQLPAKNSSYSRFEVARLFLNSLAFGRSDHNLEFHLPVKWDTARRAVHWHSVRLGSSSRCFQDLMEALSKSTKERDSSRVQVILFGLFGKSRRPSFKRGFCTKSKVWSLYCHTQEHKAEVWEQGHGRSW